MNYPYSKRAILSVVLMTLGLIVGFTYYRTSVFPFRDQMQPSQQTIINSSFVKISKEFVSGKTGRPAGTVDFLQQGYILVRDATGQVVKRAVLEEDTLGKLNDLLRGTALIHEEIVDCDPIGATDDSYERLTVVKERKTVAFVVTRNCRLPPLLSTLSQLLDKVTANHFPNLLDGK